VLLWRLLSAGADEQAWERIGEGTAAPDRWFLSAICFIS